MPKTKHLSLPGLLFLSLLCTRGSAQNFTSYRTGSTTDLVTSPAGGTCLMGGRTEDDNAMRWFLERANGGDVLVLRASGSDGYNEYLFSALGLTLNSVETIVFNDTTAAAEPYVQNAIRDAEAIWLAGGDQSRYVDYWRGTAIDSLIRDAVTNRKVVIGGTSAGMAVLGGLYFSASNGTVSSAEALADPLGDKSRIDSTRFLAAPFLDRVITDTHFSERDRQGRHLAFLARAQRDFGAPVYGIACDEYTAVCIDTAGIARVYGTAGEEDHAYFLQTNCAVPTNQPETIAPDHPLTWNRGGVALKVYRIAGTATGARSFDLTDWQTGNGGQWWDWSADNGNFAATAGEAPVCTLTGTHGFPNAPAVVVAPNPAVKSVRVTSPWWVKSVRVTDQAGRGAISDRMVADNTFTLDVRHLPEGVYYLLLTGQQEKWSTSFIKQNR